MDNQIDLLLLNAPGKDRVYQSLSSELAAYEPPIWAALIAEHIRSKNFKVSILDAEALQLSYAETVEEIKRQAPRLVVFVVYGQQPSASTQSMPAALDVHKQLKSSDSDALTLFLGTHPSALPEKTLLESGADFVCKGEGVITIAQLLARLEQGGRDYQDIPGLYYVDNHFVRSGPASENIQNLDEVIPGMAWDLLPMDKYRAHNWHCWNHIHERTPYASLYTSLGCPFKCNFCCINAPFGSSGIRYFSPEWTIRQIDTLVNEYQVKNIKIADEMFILNKKHVSAICDYIIERGYDLNIWAYARVDTINQAMLKKLKQAGFNWLGIGIESANKNVRDTIEKGKFQDVDIRDTIKMVQDAGIYIGANYIFGLPNDTFQSMQETLDLAMELNTEWANFYSSMPYPGSMLHRNLDAASNLLPENYDDIGWLGYSQHSKECLPLAAEMLSSAEILAFRDYAFDTYFSNERYLTMMKDKFGQDVLEHINFMASHSLDRNNAIGREVLMKKIADGS